MLTLQHRNKPLIRGWEGKAGRKAGSPRESLAGRRIWPWKMGSRAEAGWGHHQASPQPWGGSSPPIPTRISKFLLMLSFGVFFPLYCSQGQTHHSPLQLFKPHPRACVQGRGWQGSSTLMLPPLRWKISTCRALPHFP